ncbi:hypothetical protein G7046_g1063 [Stylonectria norvegica]|nr:hypothetical protein G7046_g1063 [Stylonectria norvegica]
MRLTMDPCPSLACLGSKTIVLWQRHPPTYWLVLTNNSLTGIRDVSSASDGVASMLQSRRAKELQSRRVAEPQRAKPYVAEPHTFTITKFRAVKGRVDHQLGVAWLRILPVKACVPSDMTILHTTSQSWG